MVDVEERGWDGREFLVADGLEDAGRVVVVGIRGCLRTVNFSGYLSEITDFVEKAIL